MKVENGSFGGVLIAGTVVFGVVGVLAAILYLYMSAFNYEVQPSDSEKEAVHKKRRFAQRMIALFGSAAAGVVALGYLFVLFIVGTFVRSDGYTVNWTYFSFLALAAGLVGLLHGYFFRLDGYSRRVTLGGMWAVAMVLLAVAPVTPHGSKRDLCFGVSVALQGLSLLYVFWFEGVHGPLKHLYGWLAAGPVVVAFALYDIFWFIGYLNEASSAVVFTSRWKVHLAFFFADLCMYVVSPVVAFLLYRPLRATHDDAIELPTMDAGVSLGSTGAGAYANLQGFSSTL